MDKDKLYQWFLEHNIKSISPHIAMLLIDIAKEFKPRIKMVKNNELRRDLEDFEDALITVCHVATIHQKAVIDKLGVLIKGP